MSLYKIGIRLSRGGIVSMLYKIIFIYNSTRPMDVLYKFDRVAQPREIISSYMRIFEKKLYPPLA